MIRSLLILIFALTSIAALAQDEFGYDYIPDATYAQMEERLSLIENEIPLHFNDRVKSFIDYFTVRDRPYTRTILERKDYYFNIFEPYLESYDIPDEIKYLAIVESGLKPNAVSRASAVGLWQFISSTGKIYGLNSNWYVDDRMDPFAATDAACRHLIDLYNMFEDWELALAAYNCGPGNVRKAIRRSGYKDEFWEIYRYLPRETRGYVPQFVAMIYALNYAEEHNLYPETLFDLPEFDTIMVSQYFHLETFANNADICMEDLIALNPDIKRGALPEGTTNFDVKIPIESKERVVANRTYLYDTASRVGKEHLDYLARNTPGSTYGRVKQVYRVRSGDVLGTIAQKYHVRISDIKKWNNLNSSLIRVGQRLNIWVLPAYSSETKDLYTSARTNGHSQPVDSGDKKIYYVQNGDSLWSISRDKNLSIEKLKQLNNLRSNTIHAGQPLIIATE